MKTIYKLRINKRDDYSRSHDTLVCEILEIDENSKRITEHLTIVDGEEVVKSTKSEYLINGEFRSFKFSDEYFESLDKLKKHLKSEYYLAKTSKHDFLLLVVDDLYNSVVAISNFKNSFYSCSKDFVNLQELLELEYIEENNES